MGDETLFGIPLEEVKSRLRDGASLDDMVAHLNEGDLVYVYNPGGDEEEAAYYAGAVGHIVEAHPERDAYLVDAIEREEWFELGQKWFARNELELLTEQYNPRYFDEMRSAPWWPDVARDRVQAQSRMREESTKRRENESPRMKEAEERYWSGEMARVEEARSRRDEYLEERARRD